MSRRVPLLALVLAAGLAACSIPIPTPVGTTPASPVQPKPTPAPSPKPTPAPVSTPSPRADGAIESLEPIAHTAHSEYFKLTYWSGGLRVKGFLGRPSKGKGYPAVIYNRGGNRELGALEGPEIVPFVEAGFVTVASQYRGNEGSEGREQFGGADVDDVINLVPLLKGLREVDPARIGMFGMSRGGMMTFLALKHETLAGTNDVKAAVTIGAPSDLVAWMKTRVDMIPILRDLVGGAPDESALRDRSAVQWPGKIGSPLLLLHGEADGRVPVAQSRRLAELLTRAGKTVKIVTYPGDDHALSGHDGGYPETFAWFERYIGKPGEDHSFERHVKGMEEALEAWPK